jgi:hypothetical protein
MGFFGLFFKKIDLILIEAVHENQQFCIVQTHLITNQRLVFFHKIRLAGAKINT